MLTTLKRALAEAIGGSAKAITIQCVLQAQFEVEYMRQVFTSFLTDGLRGLLESIANLYAEALSSEDREQLLTKYKHLKANFLPVVLKRTALNVRCFTGTV